MKDKDSVFDQDPQSVDLGMVLELTVEELEAKIAPGVELNHNETLVLDVDGDSSIEMVLEPAVEELEAKMAPAALGVTLNHNETLVLDLEEEANIEMVLEPAIEELESIIAPGRSVNHNETLLQDNA